ncbi:unnamed protein product [Cladocopium goreaui]|uniref:Sulfotransferase domain-containing protein n=1 Tax=Cladocopium goreaui TaxID=2562237 RepID=A0A9P1G124_9DINO|nr:unnamed protein product [Cladocopium goreaui]
MSRPRAPMRAPRAPHAPHAPQAPQAQRRQAQAAQEPQSEPDTSICPLPPYRSWLRPPNRTALASHPRSGSTWTRFLLERASSSACGFEDPGWANVLPHAGGVEGKPDDINEDGLIIKTHSICFGCWPDAPIWKRLRVRNTSLAPQEAHRLLGPTEVTEKLESIGTCLIFPPGSLEAAIKVRKNFNLEKKQAIQLHCTKMYDRAVVLIRDPLDVFRSNYHYRTKVLGLQRGRSWSKDQHAFVRERAEAWMNFYRSWRDFAQVRPAMLVYYELLKLNPAHEVQRMLQFLQVEVTPEKLTCAIEQTTMGKLKVDRSSKGRVDETRFFGSRKETEAKENLTYPTTWVCSSLPTAWATSRIRAWLLPLRWPRARAVGSRQFASLGSWWRLPWSPLAPRLPRSLRWRRYCLRSPPASTQGPRRRRPRPSRAREPPRRCVCTWGRRSPWRSPPASTQGPRRRRPRPSRAREPPRRCVCTWGRRSPWRCRLSNQHSGASWWVCSVGCICAACGRTVSPSKRAAADGKS